MGCVWLTSGNCRAADKAVALLIYTVLNLAAQRPEWSCYAVSSWFGWLGS
jgi:hypothetical protein